MTVSLLPGGTLSWVHLSVEDGHHETHHDYHLNDGQTGDEAVRLVRAQRGHDIPAIIISADRSDELKVRLDAQEMPLLGKPIKPAQMRALLRTMLS